MIATIQKQDYEDLEGQTTAAGFLGDVESRFSESDGINVASAELRSEAELSLEEFLMLKRWDFDDLTLRTEGSERLH